MREISAANRADTEPSKYGFFSSSLRPTENWHYRRLDDCSQNLALAASGFLILSRLVTVFPVLRSLKLGNRASLIPAINLAQISEFSLVIGAIGVSLGHISDGTLSLIVFMLVITSVVSTYMILFNHQIYEVLNPARYERSTYAASASRS